jgi:hypothetical protein
MGVRPAARGTYVPLDGFRGWVELVTSSALICRSVERSSLFVVDVATSGVRSPLSLVCPGFPVSRVSLADEVVVENGTMRIGLADLDVAAIPLWQPQLPNALGGRGLRVLASLGTCAPRPALDNAHDRVGVALARLVAAMEQPSSFGCEFGEALDATIGLGPGLTPSGDDALVGLLTLLSHSEHGAPVLHRLRSSIEQRLCATTHYSARLLQLAGLGETHEGILRVLCAANDPDALPAAVERLLTFGATSGADTVIGVVAGAQLLLRSDPRQSSPIGRAMA